MKKLQAFKMEDEIPSRANFVCIRDDEFIYEVPIKSTSSKKEIKDLKGTVERVVTYLNKKTNGRYNPENKAVIGLIKARLQESAEPEDFKEVIDKQCIVWMGDGEWQKYLRPSTLFGNKFYNYLSSSNEETGRSKAFDELDKINEKVLQDA